MNAFGKEVTRHCWCDQSCRFVNNIGPNGTCYCCECWNPKIYCKWCQIQTGGPSLCNRCRERKSKGKKTPY